MTLLAAEAVRRFNLTPIVALLSHSSFGSSAAPEAQLMREARAILIEQDPELIVEGEMRGDVGVDDALVPPEKKKRDVPRVISR